MVLFRHKIKHSSRNKNLIYFTTFHLFLKEELHLTVEYFRLPRCQKSIMFLGAAKLQKLCFISFHLSFEFWTFSAMEKMAFGKLKENCTIVV